MDKNRLITKRTLKRLSVTVVSLFFCVFSLFAQNNVTVTGTVVDEAEQPLAGVGVYVKGTPRGVTTDVDGTYSISVKTNEVLDFSFLGYEPQSIPVGDKRKIDVQLKPKVNELAEATVVAFGTQKKSSVIASISGVKVSDLRIPASNLTTALAGRVAGLISYQTSGEPGADNANFLVRGVSTFGYSVEPLYLLDGFEVTKDALAYLQVDDIESFSVLKDAAATVMYGARGANGIIIITTKKGQEGSLKISARVDMNVATPTRNIKLLDGVKYMRMYNEAQLSRTPNLGVFYSEQKIRSTEMGENPMIYPNVNWYDMLFNKSTTNTKSNINLSGGGKVATYYVSGGIEHETGLLKVEKLNNFNNNISINRINLRSNVVFKLGSSTTLNTYISGRFDQYNGPSISASDVFRSVMGSNPVDFPPTYIPDEANKFTTFPLFGSANSGILSSVLMSNPYAEMVRGYQAKNSSRINAQASLKQDFDFITKGLKLELNASAETTAEYTATRRYQPFYYTVQSYNQITGQYTLFCLNNAGYSTGANYLSDVVPDHSGAEHFYYEARLSWARLFGKHNFGAMAVAIKDDKLDVSGKATDIYSSLPERNAGVSGRLTYDYDSRYFAEYGWGYNGSEKFTGNKRYGFFPAYGVGWLISNEKFWESQKRLISNLKLKFTYGKVGNDAIANKSDRFFFLSQIVDGTASNYPSAYYRWGQDMMNVFPGYTITRYANPDITWELAEKFNLGFELGLLKNEDIKLQVDFFKENRSQIYMKRANFPFTAGLQAPVGSPSNISGNVGKAASKGVDGSLDIAHNFNKDFWVQGRVNFTYATNKYIELDEPNYPYDYLKHRGYSTTQQWGLVAERLFVDDAEIANSPSQIDVAGGAVYQAGDIKYKDINGDGKIDANDRIAMGFPTSPEIQYGFGASTGFKKFDFSFFFQGNARVSFFINPSYTSPGSTNKDEGIAPFVNRRNALQFIADSYWSDTNPDVHAFWPRLSTFPLPNNTQQSSWWLRDISFMRLKSTELGYNYSGLKKRGLSNVRIYFSTENLFVISPFKLWDPEQGRNGIAYPLNKRYNMGIQLQF